MIEARARKKCCSKNAISQFIGLSIHKLKGRAKRNCVIEEHMWVKWHERICLMKREILNDRNEINVRTTSAIKFKKKKKLEISTKIKKVFNQPSSSQSTQKD